MVSSSNSSSRDGSYVQHVGTYDYNGQGFEGYKYLLQEHLGTIWPGQPPCYHENRLTGLATFARMQKEAVMMLAIDTASAVPYGNQGRTGGARLPLFSNSHMQSDGFIS
jgi:hypothetical protein